MPEKSKSVILDSWSIISYLEDENAGEKTAEIIANAHENNIPLLMSTINLGEVWYIIARKTSVNNAEEVINELTKLGIKFIDADWTITKIASMFKFKNRMSYADCFAAALAKQERGILVTGDKEFKQIENDVKIHWLV